MMRTFFISVLTLLCVCAAAQTPSFRSVGYKGSVSLTDQYGVFIGFDTSHGYMITPRHYIGIGAGEFMFPNGDDNPLFLNAFVEYQYYMRSKSSSPFLGVRAGMSHAFKFYEKSGINYHNAVLIEPSFGWSWGLESGQGLSAGIGLPMYVPFGDRRTDMSVLPMPKLSFTFEF